MIKNWIYLLAVKVAALFHSISSAEVKAALDLVIEAQKRFFSGSEKLAFVAAALAKISSGINHPDGAPTNKLHLLVSIAIDLAEQFGLMPAPIAPPPSAPPADPAAH